MVSEAALLDLIGRIYDCAIEPKAWPDTLRDIALFVGGSAAAISLQDPVKREARLIAMGYQTGIRGEHDASDGPRKGRDGGWPDTAITGQSEPAPTRPP